MYLLRSRATFFLFAFPIFAVSIVAQTPAERRARIRSALAQRDHARAAAELKSFHAASPDIFKANNFDYLMGRLAERQGDLPAASTAYQSVAARKSLLTQYAYWRLAQVARATRDLPREREYLRLLSATAPNSILRPAANRRLAQSYFESGDYPAVINLLQSSADPTRDAASREALAGLARSYLASGQKDPARAAFTTLLTRLPNPAQPDDLALEAVRALDQLDGGTAGRAPQLAEPEHLRRAIAYHFNRDFAAARLHYGEIVTRFPQSANVPDALYQTGRGYYSERQYEQAFANLQRVADQYPASINATDAVNFAAGALARMKRTDEAIVWYRRAIDNFPSVPNPERPWLNLIDALRDAGRDAEALKWADDAQRRFAGQPAAAQALFSRARIHLQTGDWNATLADLAALRALPSLPGMTLPGGTTASEVTFLQGFALEQLGRFDEAITTYLSIPDGRNEYYGGRATMRLRSLSVNERARDLIATRRGRLSAQMNQALSAGRFEAARTAAQEVLRLTTDAGETARLLDVLRRCYAAIPAYANVRTPRLMTAERTALLTAAPPATPDQPTHRALAAELLFLGLHDEGSVELATADGFGPSFNDGSPDAAFTLATLYAFGDQANNAVRYAEPLWRGVPADYVVELAPRPMIQLLYPAPYVDALLAHAPPRKVDPRLVLSIARQESRYRPDVKSYAAARGMMQFISATADQIAAEIPRPGFKQEDLYNPSVAIQFGSQYMANLFRLFPDQPQAVAASYNGGEDNVARWVARSRSTDPDRYVCEIGVAQTKDYVFKVVANYRVYQTLYDDRLTPR